MEEEKDGLGETDKITRLEPPIYIENLSINGTNCFKGTKEISLTNEDESPAMFTVILGNNNTGKTTLLRFIAAFNPIPRNRNHSSVSIFGGEKSVPPNYDLYFDKVIDNFFTFSDKNINVNFEDNSVVSSLVGLTINKLYEEGRNIKVFYSYLMRGKPPVNLDEHFRIDAYGTQRKQGKGSHIEYKLEDRVESVFTDSADNIINAEEWFLGTKFDALMDSKRAEQELEQVQGALIKLLPDIKDIQIGGEKLRRVHFITNGGDKVLINQLGSGYQSLITWVVDYAKRQFDRYPDSDNPLAEPGIVLVDEIDLHLHPTWQRKVVAFLRDLFPKTQFIVTAHSPLVVQSADDINVIVLHRDEETDDIKIEQPKLTNFQGWSIEEILRDLMDAQIHSDRYLELEQQFQEGVQENDYLKAQAAYQEFEKIGLSTDLLEILNYQLRVIKVKAHD